jgi:anti-anti-sigma factor
MMLLPHMFEASFQVTPVGSVKVITLVLPEMMDSREFDELNLGLISTLKATPQGRWLIDLSNIAYMGSASLGLMVNVRQAAKQSGGVLMLCCITPGLMKILRTCCLERLFVIVKTRDEALQKLGASAA